jgi:D-sedoheptulose 7-phosphate isomerase
VQIENLLANKARILNVALMSTFEYNKNIINLAADSFLSTIKNGNTIFWCGNGGSASESSHLATELIGRFKINRQPISSISLNADTAAITCIANDFGFDEIFSRQLVGLSKPGDLLISLSTSGNSKNIIKVLTEARKREIPTISLLGSGGGDAKTISDFPIIVDSDETARIQEIHLLIGHTLCEYAEHELGY